MLELVKYHNDMNKISFAGFNEKELNVFFSLVFLAKEKRTRELTIPFSELKILSNNDINRNKARFLSILKTLNKKLLSLNSEIKVKDTTYLFTLFTVFGINEKDDILTVKVNEIFSYILNDFIGNFTQFELENFVNLKSAYSKNMYKLLKQWETVKEKTFSVDEFRDLLGVPISYNNSKLNEKVLKPILTELPEFFPNFKMDKIKNGKKIISYKFSWSKKHQDINYTDDVEIEISEELQKAFEKASHNRFIQPFLTEDNKAELIEFFEDEKILIKGLIYAYKKIDKEFKRLSYLIKTITTGAEQQTKTIKVVKKEKKNSLNEDDYRQTSFDEIVPQPKAEEKQVEKIDIYEDEFNELYNQYLKDNNTKDNVFTKTAFSIRYNIIKREPKKEEKKIYTIEDIPEEKLIGKNGKKLVGGALKMRAKKILDEMNK